MREKRAKTAISACLEPCRELGRLRMQVPAVAGVFEVFLRMLVVLQSGDPTRDVHGHPPLNAYRCVRTRRSRFLAGRQMRNHQAEHSAFARCHRLLRKCPPRFRSQFGFWQVRLIASTLKQVHIVYQRDGVA